MPTYLLHGFRWSRPSIRIHIILQNLDDAASDWIVAPNTQRTLCHNFHKLFPESMQHLPNLRFIEQYDPDDLSSDSEQPYAYVADVVQEIKLGIDVDDVRSNSILPAQWSALVELRDRLAADEKIGWYIVVCGDEERWAPASDDSVGSLSPENSGASESESTDHSDTSTETKTSRRSDAVEQKGLKKFWTSSRLGGRKSRPEETPKPAGDQSTQNSQALKVPGTGSIAYASPLPSDQANGKVSPGVSIISANEQFDGPVELSACPPTREGLPITVSVVSDASVSNHATSRARSLRGRKPSVSPMRSSVVPSISSVGISRRVSPNDVSSRRPLYDADERQARPVTREIPSTPQVFSGIADAQKQKRRSRRFSLQSFHKGHNASTAPTVPPPPVPERSIAVMLSNLGSLSVTRRHSFHPMQQDAMQGGVSSLSLANPSPSTSDFLQPSPLSAHPPDPATDDFDDLMCIHPTARIGTTHAASLKPRTARDSFISGTDNMASQVYPGSGAYPSALSKGSPGRDEGTTMDTTAAAINAYPAPPPAAMYGAKELDATNSNLPPYFGQTVSQFELIANGIENAFVALR